MSQINIGRGRVFVNYVGEGRFEVKVVNKTGESAAIEMSHEQLNTLGKVFQAKSKEK